MTLAQLQSQSPSLLATNGYGQPGREVQAIRVFIVDDYPVVRRGLGAVLEAERGMRCIGEAAHGAEALIAVPALRPDVVVVDQDMPGIDGVSLIELLRPLVPATHFVLLTGSFEAHDVRRALAAGATNIVLKSAGSQELVNAIHAAHRGHSLHPAALTQVLATSARAEVPGADLTPRERDLLGLMAQGLSNLEIARLLAIAMPTVKFHVTNILRKLNAENRTGAVLVALRHKVVELN